MDIYHETQYSNHCALHAINALLQGPVYTFEDLVLIYQSLGQRERSLTGSCIGESQNIDKCGNFSIQVIIEALAPCDLQLVPFHSTNPRALRARQNAPNEQAFICHRNNHWFTLRKLGTTWYHFNSLLPFPQQIDVNGT